MSEKIYWTSIEEKESIDNGQMPVNRQEELPSLNGITDGISEKAGTNRRDFLKVLGFSVGAAAVAASCEMPVRRSIPYIFKPEEITPGMASYYASSFSHGGDFCAVLVKTREGRPILVEGNPASSISKGGVSAKVSASVLGLYDAARYKTPLKNGQETKWETADGEIGKKLDEIAASGKAIVLLTGTVISPSTKAAIEVFKQKYSGLQHVQYDAVSYSGLLAANQQMFGKRELPDYHFDKADVVVAIACDFLGTWLSHIEYAADYSARRKVSKEVNNMNRHIQMEAIPTITGSVADENVRLMPADEVNAVIELYNQVAAKAGGAGVNNGDYKNSAIAAIADELYAAKGKSLVVCGINDVNVQMLVNGINQMLGNYGNTLDFDHSNMCKQGDETLVAALVKNAASVGAILIAECNPAYAWGDNKGMEALIKGAALSVSFSERMDETSALTQYVLPTCNWLESWGDAEPKRGIICTQQPVINNLFPTRQWQETLLKWSGKSESYYDFVQANWQQTIMARQSKYSSFMSLWSVAVHDGEINTSASAPVAFEPVGGIGQEPVINETPQATAVTSPAGNMSEAAAKALASIGKKGKNQLRVYQKVGITDGYLSDNPFIQEVPNPITKATWDNYFVANKKWMKDNNVLMGEDYEFKYYKITVKAGNTSVTLPVIAVPGVQYGAIGVALGYGRKNTFNKHYENGANAYPFLNENLNDVSVTYSAEKEELAVTQKFYELTLKGLGGYKTRYMVKETTLDQYRKDAQSGNIIDGTPRNEWIEHHLKTLYPEHEMPGHQWGMAIDLNSCIGCSACVVACNIENNVPVVGKEQVRRGHEMHWLRIDKYYAGDIDNPEVIFQPMLCQHCDNAPCENVCPVGATNHSQDGLNQMAYNRCIGTRYCANNCPYKVRRFNWLDYTEADSFQPRWTIWDNYKGTPYDNGLDLNNAMNRMVLNPDVTVRSRGVIEKCSFCVQRIQKGKLDAKNEGRGLQEGDIKTACQSVCPTNAITFGDVNNSETTVAKMQADERAYGVIEEIHTLPSVMYLTKVRNSKKSGLFETTLPHHEA